MSPNSDDPREQKKKKYLWFGYGGYANFGEFGPTNPGNIRADPGIFDKLFELFGVKEKPKKEHEEDRK
ncbi:MAG TPA: hypothetical protein VK880_13240 [Anaerolineales bacterium]|nr:hypothetical protein [Anaerolineales bacterium]